jgi:glycosyltransferase involved in cell wall biosynthesis
MKNIPKIDVVLPVGTDDEYLDKTIASLRNSRNVDLRILLIDNTTLGIPFIKSRISKNDLVFREEKRGFANAINSPLLQNHEFADFVAVMNSDDLCHPDRFIIQVSELVKTGSELNICSVQNFRDKNIVNAFFGSITYHTYTPMLLSLGAYGIEPTWVARNNWWTKYSYRSPEVHPDIADLDCALRAFPSSSISSVPDKLYYYRKHSKQMSRNAARQEHFSTIETHMRKLFSAYGIENPSTRTFYLSRPHNMLADRVTPLDRARVLQHLNNLSEFFDNSQLEPMMREQIRTIIQIRKNSLNKFKSFARLTSLRSKEILQTNNEAKF